MPNEIPWNNPWCLNNAILDISTPDDLAYVQFQCMTYCFYLLVESKHVVCGCVQYHVQIITHLFYCHFFTKEHGKKQNTVLRSRS